MVWFDGGVSEGAPWTIVGRRSFTPKGPLSSAKVPPVFPVLRGGDIDDGLTARLPFFMGQGKFDGLAEWVCCCKCVPVGNDLYSWMMGFVCLSSAEWLHTFPGCAWNVKYGAPWIIIVIITTTMINNQLIVAVVIRIELLQQAVISCQISDECWKHFQFNFILYSPA